MLALASALVGVGTLALWAQEQAKQARKQTQVTQQRLIQAVGVADHVVFNVSGRLERVPGVADLRKGLLAETMKMLDELQKQAGAGEDPSLLRTRSAGHVQRGDLAMTHDNQALAQSEYCAALQLFEALAERQPDSAQAQRDLSVSLDRLGDVTGKMGQLGEAKSWFERSMKILEKLALADSNDAQAQRDLIVSHYKLADLFTRSRQPTAARAEARLAADLLTKLRPRLPKHDADNLDQAIRALLR